MSLKKMSNSIAFPMYDWMLLKDDAFLSQQRQQIINSKLCMNRTVDHFTCGSSVDEGFYLNDGVSFVFQNTNY